MRALLAILLICLLAPAAVVLAEDQPPAAAVAAAESVLTEHSKGVYAGLKAILLRSAEKMPEENYAFKPTDTVRSFGQIVGHVADAQYLFCSVVRGEKNPARNVEKTTTSKAELIAALNDAFTFCDKAYDGLTDTSATETVKFMGQDTPKLGVLHTNALHAVEHYGNLVTYLRMKNLVPPTSEPEFMRQLMSR